MPDAKVVDKICPERKNYPCISLIGMPGAGKSTIGAMLARRLGWAFMDSDYLMEALYAARLQDITDALGKEAFLDLECAVVCSIRASRCVLATGGSVVYRPEAMRHLAGLGPVAHLDLSLETVAQRIALNPERGIAIGPDQTLEDIYRERKALYAKHATMTCDCEKKSPEQCVAWLAGKLPEEFSA